MAYETHIWGIEWLLEKHKVAINEVNDQNTIRKRNTAASNGHGKLAKWTCLKIEEPGTSTVFLLLILFSWSPGEMLL